MRILVPLISTSSGTWGGLTRALAIASAARAAGHDVVFCTGASQRSMIEQHGYTVYPLPSTTMFGLPARLASRLEKRAQRSEPPAFAAGRVHFKFVRKGASSGTRKRNGAGK